MRFKEVKIVFSEKTITIPRKKIFGIPFALALLFVSVICCIYIIQQDSLYMIDSYSKWYIVDTLYLGRVIVGIAIVAMIFSLKYAVGFLIKITSRWFYLFVAAAIIWTSYLCVEGTLAGYSVFQLNDFIYKMILLFIRQILVVTAILLINRKIKKGQKIQKTLREAGKPAEKAD